MVQGTKRRLVQTIVQVNKLYQRCRYVINAQRSAQRLQTTIPAVVTLAGQPRAISISRPVALSGQLSCIWSEIRNRASRFRWTAEPFTSSFLSIGAFLALALVQAFGQGVGRPRVVMLWHKHYHPSPSSHLGCGDSKEGA